MQKLSIFSRIDSLLFQSSKRSFLLLAIGVALLIRLALVLFVSDPRAIMSDPTHTLLYEHGIVAHNLYTGHGFSVHWQYQSIKPERRAIMAQPPTFESAILPPLHPYLLFAS